MDYQRKPRRPIPAAPEKEFLNDAEAAFVVGCGMTKLAELERTDPNFPAPIWLGPRGKRHVRAELRAYVLGKRQRVPV